MFAFNPLSFYGPQSLRQPQGYHQQPQSPLSPRDKYLAALASANAAEAEYVADLAREKAIEEAREAERTRQVALQQQRQEEIQRQLLLESVHSQEFDALSHYPSSPRYQRFNAEVEADLFVHREMQLRRTAAAHHRQQQQFIERKHIALLQEEEKRIEQERVRALLIARHIAEKKLNVQEQVRQNLQSQTEEDCIEQILRSLFGGHVTIRKAPSPEQLARPRVHPTHQLEHGHRYRHTIPTEQDDKVDVDQFLKIMFGGKSRPSQCQRACSRSIQENPREEVAPQFCQAADRCQFQIARPVAPELQTPAPALTTSSAPASFPTPSSAMSLKEQLAARLRSEAEPEVRDTLQNLLASILGVIPGSYIPQRNEQQAPAPAVMGLGRTPAAAAGLSLKEQLEARLHKDPNVETSDINQAILASLAPKQRSVATPATPTATVIPSSSSSVEGKGKGKETLFDLAESTSTEPTSKDVLNSMNAIRNLDATFTTISQDFTFPSKLDFTPTSSAPSSPIASDNEESSFAEHLAFTSTNAPVRYYEQALNTLLGQLDAVESWGNEDVRKARKDLVARVEGALGEVEREVHLRLVQRQARNTLALEKKESEVKQKVGQQEAPVVVSSEELFAEVSPQEAAEETLEVSEPYSTTPIDSQSTLELSPESDLVHVLSESQATVIPTHVTSTTIDKRTADSAAEGLTTVSKSVIELPSMTFSAPEVITDIGTQLDTDEPSAQASYSQVSATPAVGTANSSSIDLLIEITEPETPDTFLLPSKSPVISKRPNVTQTEEDELVVVDKEHGEGSDWSEVEA